MNASDLGAIAAALQERYKHGELFAEFAAATGERQGELFAITSDDIDLETRLIKVWWQFNAKAGKLTLPKMRKRRTAIYCEGPTITGYDLGAALAKRCVEAAAERDSGTNVGALLFPAPRGGYWNESNFDTRVWVPAMSAAGMPFIEFAENARAGQHAVEKARRLYRYTTHSLRDRFAISALNVWGWSLDELMVVGGWSNTKVIHDRYYGVARGVLDRLRHKTALPQ